jgi:pyruvate formate lyase activating enzyme
LQTEFLSELFALAHERGIHTALDTSGITFRGADPALDGLMKNTDLVLLDIKAIDREGHKILTGRDNAPVLKFAKYLEARDIPVWVRHVVVPGYTDGADGLFALGKFIGTLKNLRALDVLPYHTLGVSKYAQLGIEYKLAGVPPTDRAAAEEARKTILAGIREVRGEIKNKPQ